MSSWGITFKGLITLAGLFSAYMLGRMSEKPEAKWPQGSFLKGGWKAWKIPYIVSVSLAAAIVVLLPLLQRTTMFSGMFSGMYRGGYAGGGYAGGMYG